jgi:glutamyl-tRNA synthetase
VTRVRTRFAPSPTGELHLGNARTAVLNWAFARRHGGDFVLRFEDTDVERTSEGAERAVLEGLGWLELVPDEGPGTGGEHGPYRQSERLPLYRDHASRLLERGRAYHCYCTAEELAARREAALAAGRPVRYDGRCRDLSDEEEAARRSEGRTPSVRFRADAGTIRVPDRVRGDVEFEGSELGDMVILRSDGRPTYNFAVVVDDLLMEISHVIRGADHLSNTPKQVLLYRALDADPPEFAHIPLVLAPGGGGLSKREDARGLLAYRELGYHPDAVVNYLSLLAWSSPSGDEVLSRERIVAEIDLDRLGRADTEVDPEKMRWLSGRHIAADPPDRLAERLRPYLASAGLELGPRDLRAAAEVLGDRIQLLTEAVEELRRLLPEPDVRDEARDALEAPGAAGVLEAARTAWSQLDAWDRDGIRRALEEAKGRVEAGGAAFYHPLRAALTGELQGPELPGVAYLLGRDRTLRRVERGLEVSFGAREDGKTREEGA